MKKKDPLANLRQYTKPIEPEQIKAVLEELKKLPSLSEKELKEKKEDRHIPFIICTFASALLKNRDKNLKKLQRCITQFSLM